MNLAKFIQNHKELNELPFLIVFRTLSILQNMGMLKMFPSFASKHFVAHTWMYSVRELKICLVTARALEKLCCPDSSMMSFPE